jgi:hypothetical protein
LRKIVLDGNGVTFEGDGGGTGCRLSGVDGFDCRLDCGVGAACCIVSRGAIFTNFWFGLILTNVIFFGLYGLTIALGIADKFILIGVINCGLTGGFDDVLLEFFKVICERVTPLLETSFRFEDDDDGLEVLTMFGEDDDEELLVVTTFTKEVAATSFSEEVVVLVVKS